MIRKDLERKFEITCGLIAVLMVIAILVGILMDLI